MGNVTFNRGAAAPNRARLVPTLLDAVRGRIRFTPTLPASVVAAAGVIRAVWQGPVGNSSPNALTMPVTDSAPLHHGLSRVMSVTPGSIDRYACRGYLEGPGSHFRFTAADPQVPLRYQTPPANNTLSQATTRQATRGDMVLHLGSDYFQYSNVNPQYFIYAVSESTGERVDLGTGTNYSMTYGVTYVGVILLEGFASSLAAQQTGSLVYVALPELNKVACFDLAAKKRLADQTFYKPWVVAVDPDTDKVKVSYFDPGNPDKTPVVQKPGVNGVEIIGQNGQSVNVGQAKAFDGDTSTQYISGDPGGNLGLFLGENTILTQLRVYAIANQLQKAGGILEGSFTNFNNDDHDAVTLVTLNVPATAAGWTTYPITTTVAYPYVRLRTVGTNGNDGEYLNINELELSGYQLTDTSVTKEYTAAANGTLTATGVTLTGLVRPLAMDIRGGKTMVVDAGTSQQVKTYASSGGAPTKTFGQAGGYASSIVVADDRFSVGDRYQTTRSRKDLPAGIAMLSDGSWWLVDAGNNRTLHFTADNVLIPGDTIAYQPNFYECCGDLTATKYVYGHWLGWETDSSKVFGPNTGAWTLKYNLSGSYNSRIFGYIYDVATLVSGRTYGLLQRSHIAGEPSAYSVELTPTGVRFTANKLPFDYRMDAAGNFFRWKVSNTGVLQISTLTRTGFDSNNDLVLNSEVVQDGPTLTSKDVRNPQIIKLNNGNYALYDGNKYSTYPRKNDGTDYDATGYYHLGILTPGSPNWVYRGAPELDPRSTGDYPTDGSFDGRANDTNGLFLAMQDIPGMSRSILIRGQSEEFFKGSGLQTNCLVVQDGTTGAILHTFAVTSAENPVSMSSVVRSGAFYATSATTAKLVYNEQTGRGLPTIEYDGLPAPAPVPTGDGIDYALPTTKAYPAASSYTFETTVIQGSSYAAVCVVRGETGYSGAGPFLVQNRRLRNNNGNAFHAYMPNGQQVIVRNCVLAGTGTGDLANFTDNTSVWFDSCIFMCDGSQPIGAARARGVYGYKGRNVKVTNCYFLNTAGAKLEYWSDYATDTDTIVWQNNRYDNICGGNNDYRQFLQLQHIYNRPGIDIGWNQVVNAPGQSRVEDNLNLGFVSGTAASPLHVHDNFVRGAYPTNPAAKTDNSGNYSGTGMTTDSNASAPVEQQPAYILAENNQWVATMNAAMNIAAGHHITYRNNRAAISGTLADGTKMPAVNNALGVFNNYGYSEAQFHDNVATGNYLHVNTGNGENALYVNGDLGPNSIAPTASNNTVVDGATYADEQAEFAIWQAKLASNKVLLGPAT